jgi:flagellar biogenesis protein FliO
LNSLAPTQSEAPFKIAQLLALVLFVLLAFLAFRRFRVEPAIS